MEDNSVTKVCNALYCAGWPEELAKDQAIKIDEQAYKIAGTLGQTHSWAIDNILVLISTTKYKSSENG